MSKKNGYYLLLPEDFLDRPPVQKLIARYGFGAVTIYHDLQTRMRDYEKDGETSFMIPAEDLSFLCFRYRMKQEQLQEMVNYLYLVDLFKVYEVTDGETTARYYYAEDTRELLLGWVSKRERLIEAGKRGAYRRYNRERKATEEQDETN